ncbi:ABC transporter permease [Stagnihabitans tardus]|uniref:ABC transporter permease subunit n=1 Tax=Stagnihabitans tardus TaxID=2699202 RepID=A0AAE4Y9C4_9RHOB|nr:iron ABC transporter permease [Stagnihabitans tardus]NBZ86144.1 ABC transporter permease subunit [Stagnihabitans tardus]
MTQQKTQARQDTPRARQFFRPDGWSLLAVAITALVMVPVLSVLWIAAHPTENIWPHLLSTVLPRYLWNTAVLGAGVGALATAIGTGAAWLLTMYRFPGSRWLDRAMLFPLAIPAYIGAYALVDFLDYAGPLQTALRALMGWQSARDYAFPEIRSMGFAILVLASAYYPYVYLLARSAFREQSGGSYEVARALGASPLGLFLRVGLPLARPAIAAGLALVLMETLADFGAVQHFAVQTLTTGVFSTWLNSDNAGGAAQLAFVILTLILFLVLSERASRRRALFHKPSRATRPVTPMRLTGPWAVLATLACLLPLGMGFGLPVGVMAGHALRHPSVWLAPGLGQAMLNTLVVGALAAALTVGLALLLVHALRQGPERLSRVVLPLTSLGYAAPGAVLAVGILIPLAALDHRLADAILAVTGTDPGLLLTGTAAAVVLAYVIRFFGVAQGAIETAFGRISPVLPLAARALGESPTGVLRRIHLPLMRGSVWTAVLIVFVDSVKELPATLMLRPFNFNTLATRAYDLASLEKIGQGAPAALIVGAVGLVAVWALLHEER